MKPIKAWAVIDDCSRAGSFFRKPFIDVVPYGDYILAIYGSRGAAVKHKKFIGRQIIPVLISPIKKGKK